MAFGNWTIQACVPTPGSTRIFNRRVTEMAFWPTKEAAGVNYLEEQFGQPEVHFGQAKMHESNQGAFGLIANARG